MSEMIEIERVVNDLIADPWKGLNQLRTEPERTTKTVEFCGTTIDITVIYTDFTAQVEPPAPVQPAISFGWNEGEEPPSAPAQPDCRDAWESLFGSVEPYQFERGIAKTVDPPPEEKPANTWSFSWNDSVPYDLVRPFVSVANEVYYADGEPVLNRTNVVRSNLTDDLRAAASRPDCLVYPGGRPYVSTERLTEIADQVDAAVASLATEAAEWEAAHNGAVTLLNAATRETAKLAAWGEKALMTMVLLIGQIDDLTAENAELEKEGDGLAESLKDMIGAFDEATARADRNRAQWCRLWNAHIQVCRENIALRKERDAAVAEASRQEGFADVSDNIATSLGSRLTNLDADLSGLLCELGVDAEDLGEDELLPALRGAIAKLQAKAKPRSLLSRFLGC